MPVIYFSLPPLTPLFLSSSDRYLLYNFPLTAAVVGVGSNFLFLSVAVLFGYLQIIWGGLWPPEQVRVRVSSAKISSSPNKPQCVRVCTCVCM